VWCDFDFTVPIFPFEEEDVDLRSYLSVFLDTFVWQNSGTLLCSLSSSQDWEFCVFCLLLEIDHTPFERFSSLVCVGHRKKLVRYAPVLHIVLVPIIRFALLVLLSKSHRPSQASDLRRLEDYRSDFMLLRLLLNMDTL